MPDFTYDVGRVSFIMKGAWNLATAYEKLDAVTHDGSLYIAKQNVPGGTAISNTTYWQLAAEKGDQGPTGGVDSVNGRTGAVTGLAEEHAVGGTLRQLLMVSQGTDFNNTDWVDLGTLTWYKGAAAGGHYRFSATLTGLKNNPSATVNSVGLMCTKYLPVSPNDTWFGYNVGISSNIGSSSLLVYDSNYESGDAAAFKAAMKGVLLAFEKE